MNKYLLYLSCLILALSTSLQAQQEGTLKWSFETGGPVYSSPAIGADGSIYIVSRDNKLYALNPDGTLRWSYAAVEGDFTFPIKNIAVFFCESLMSVPSTTEIKYSSCNIGTFSFGVCEICRSFPTTFVSSLRPPVTGFVPIRYFSRCSSLKQNIQKSQNNPHMNCFN